MRGGEEGESVGTQWSPTQSHLFTTHLVDTLSWAYCLEGLCPPFNGDLADSNY